MMNFDLHELCELLVTTKHKAFDFLERSKSPYNSEDLRKLYKDYYRVYFGMYKKINEAYKAYF